MDLVRRIIVALGLAALAAAGIRIGGGGVAPSQRGGWRPLVLPPERDRLRTPA